MNALLDLLQLAALESTATGTLTVPNRFNLSIENYVNMQISNFGTNQNTNIIPCSFKISLNATNETIYYSFTNSGKDQYIDNTDRNLILDIINVTLK